MKKLFTLAFSLCFWAGILSAQEPFTIRLDPDFVPTIEEEVRYDAQGLPVSYSKVSDPSITVCLPAPEKADGSAILIMPGGAMVSLTWDSEFRQIASWLNERGIAAIGLKYHLRGGLPQAAQQPRPQQARPQAQPRPQQAAGGISPAERGKIYNFMAMEHANAGPGGGGKDETMDLALNDALKAMKMVQQHADEWKIDPARIGWMGFSAGGCVALAALMEAPRELFPAYFCSVYGPSTVDITVPENAPKLYIAVHADHPSVAAGCMALFMEWKKAGADAEIHVYNGVTGGFYGGAGTGVQNPTPEGYWLETFYSWLHANGYLKK